MPVQDLKITVAQLNPVVGDVVGNVERIRETYFEAERRGRRLVVTPWLSVTGCPLEALADCPDLLDAVDAALAVLGRATRGRKAALIVGAPRRDAAGVNGLAFVFRDGDIVGTVAGERLVGTPGGTGDSLPPAGDSLPFDLGGLKAGVIAGGPRPGAARRLRDNGADMLVSICANPFRPDGAGVRAAAAECVAETGLPLLCVNAVGGQGETVFDGGSFLLDREGAPALCLPLWEECVMDHDVGTGGSVPGGEPPDPLERVAKLHSACFSGLSELCFVRLSHEYSTIFASKAGLAQRQQDEKSRQSEFYNTLLENIWRAMMLGVRDYARKSGFTDVVLGLSGGMDSALVAAVAGDSLGPGRVHCVRLPSRHTSDLSNAAADEMCRVWGFSMDTLPIGEVVDAAGSTLSRMFPGGLKKLTMENMQARARGYLLMSVSNDRGWLLLSTGNKSEIAVGYSTLYGDMCGGFNPLKNVFKTTVYALAEWRNRNRPAGLLGPAGVAIPVEILERPPSAELSPGQMDTDSLPPYPVLDAVLGAMLDERLSLAEIAARGFDREMVDAVHRMVKRAEHKRRQGAPGPEVGGRAFARMPIVNGFGAAMTAALRNMERF